jgi:hypothetical protein
MMESTKASTLEERKEGESFMQAGDLMNAQSDFFYRIT